MKTEEIRKKEIIDSIRIGRTHLSRNIVESMIRLFDRTGECRMDVFKELDKDYFITSRCGKINIPYCEFKQVLNIIKSYTGIDEDIIINKFMDCLVLDNDKPSFKNSPFK